MIVAAPVSGVVMAVNETLPKRLGWLISDPCGEGWIAHICTTEYDREAEQCGPRRIILANADPSSAERAGEETDGAWDARSSWLPIARR